MPTKHLLSLRTQPGDVLILGTSRAFTIHVVGQVSTDGQQDFHGQTDALYIADRATAVAAAKTLAMTGSRILLRTQEAMWRVAIDRHGR